MIIKSKKKICIVICFFLLACLFQPVSLLKSSAKNKTEDDIFIKSMKINPYDMTNIPDKFLKNNYTKDELGSYIITFNGPIHDYMKNEVINLGAKLDDYLPDFSFLALMTPDIADKIGNLPYVKKVTIYQPIFKLAEILAEQIFNNSEIEETEFNIVTFSNADSPVNQILSIGGKILDLNANTYTISLQSDLLSELVNINSIKYVEPVPKHVLFNDAARPYMGVDEIASIGFNGDGQVIGICDTGLDTGKNDSSMHKDFQGRIDNIIALGRNVATDPHGHGTHVAGSVLGSGAMSDGKYKGIAPKARLVFQSVLDSNGGLGGLPKDLTTLFSQAWNSGARIHTNSWGASVKGEYTTESQSVDRFVWNNDMIILFAAGNEGAGNTGTTYKTIGSPGTAKNCITVGASENYRPDMPNTKWGNIGDNPNEIAPFSSRGNCKDGRIKPDIVAPGTWILSTKSSLAPESNFWKGFNNYYAYMGGTSMSTPLTAGAVAVAREYMQKRWNHTPSPAMMKAALINGGTDLGFGFPSRDQGWGRVSLVNSLISREYKFEDQTIKLSTGQKQQYKYTVESANMPFKTTLVWTDYPGSTSASKALVNDLDLKITSPSGKVYFGNDFVQPFNDQIDRLNNVENIFINNPEIGEYTIEVTAYNIPQGPQSFALFASGNFGTSSPSLNPPTCTITYPTNNAKVNGIINIQAEASDDKGVAKVEFYVDGKKINEDTTYPYTVDWDSTTNDDNSLHTIQAKAYDTDGNIGESSVINVIVNNPSQTQYTTSTTSGSVSWFSPREYSLNVTSRGTITINLSSSSKLKLELYRPDGTLAAKGTTKISYNAEQTGEYTIVVSSSSLISSKFTLTVKYPVK